MRLKVKSGRLIVGNKLGLSYFSNWIQADFSGGPAAKPPNAGDPSLILGQGTRSHMP